MQGQSDYERELVRIKNWVSVADAAWWRGFWLGTLIGAFFGAAIVATMARLYGQA
jgi:hypothetical protein